MEKENKKEILKLHSRNKMNKNIFIYAFLLSIVLIALGIIFANKELPDPVDVSEVTNTNQYVKCDIYGITECFADYTINGSVKEEYYFATDGYVMDNGVLHLYILNLSKKQYDNVANTLEGNGSSDIKLNGVSEYLSSDLKKIAIDTYNEMYPDTEITEENYYDYITPYVINATITPNSEISNMLYGFAFISGAFGLIFAIGYISSYIGSKNNINKFFKNCNLDEFMLQYNDVNKMGYDKVKIMLLNDYLIDYNGKIEIIKYKEIVWAYVIEHRNRGVIVSKGIGLGLKDKTKHEIALTSEASKKEIKDQYNQVFDEIIKRRPNILIGASNENLIAMNKDNIDNTIKRIDDIDNNIEN